MHNSATIAAFDIAADGRAVEVADIAAPPTAGVAWRWLHFDLAAPGVAEWLEGALPDIAFASLTQSETRPRADFVADGVIANLRGVNMNPGAEADDMVSLRLWMTGNQIVSVRLRKIFAVDDIRVAAEAGTAPPTPAAFLETVAAGMAARIETISTALDDATGEMEDHVFAGAPPDPGALAALRRRTIRLLRFLGPQKTAMDRLCAAESPLIDDMTRTHLREIANRSARSVEELTAARDRLEALSDLVDAIQAARIASNSYVLSIVAALFLPLGFLTGVFGMNVAGLPGTEGPGAFLLLTVCMSVLGVGLIWLMRFKKWF